MSIFGKKTEKTRQTSTTPAPKQSSSSHTLQPPLVPATPAASKRRSYLSAGCELVGDFMGEGSFECSGSFEGKIDLSGDVIIGQSGTAEAQLKASSISIDGRLHGDATGTEKVQVGASGHVEGNLRAPAVQFIEGAFFEGNVEMRRPEHVGPEGDSTRNDEAAGEPSGEEAKNDVNSDDPS